VNHRLRRARRFDHAQIRRATYPLLDMAPEMYVACPSRIRRRYGVISGVAVEFGDCAWSRGVLPVRLFGDDFRRLGWVARPTAGRLRIQPLEAKSLDPQRL